jgi:insulysin
LHLLYSAIYHNLRSLIQKEKEIENLIEVQSEMTGITVKIQSSTKMLNITCINFLQNLMNMEITEDSFKIYLEEMKNSNEKLKNLLPKLLAFEDFKSIIQKDYLDKQSILENARKLNFKIFQQNFKNLFQKFYTKILIYGNYEHADAIVLNEEFKKLFSPKEYKPIIDKTIRNYNNMHANLTGYYIYRHQLSDNHNHDHAVLNIYQIGDYNIANLYRTYLIKMLVGYVYFTELRIKEQLGYSTKGNLVIQDGLIYFVISVQGSRVNPDKIDLKIEEVIPVMRKKIEQTSKKKFQKTKHHVYYKLTRKDSSLKDRTNRIWGEMISRRRYFDIRRIVNYFIKVNEKSFLKKQNILDFFDEVFTKSLKKISVQVFNKDSNKDDKEQVKVSKIIRGGETLPFEPVVLPNRNYFRTNKKY